MRALIPCSLPLLAVLAGFGAYAAPRTESLVPQVTGDPLSRESAPPISGEVTKLPETDAAFRPAPIPNPDVDAPRGASAPSAPSISPAFFSQKQLADGDGYSHASSVDAGQDKRRAPAAGLNWSVPVK